MTVVRINKALNIIDHLCNQPDSKYFQYYKTGYNSPDSILSIIYRKIICGEEIYESEILDYVFEKITKFHNIRI